jgi:Zn-dependent protease
MMMESIFAILAGMDVNIAYVVIVLVVVLLSMTLHEAMHGFVAYWLGDDTAKREGRLTVNPIAHIDPFLTILLPLLLAVSGGPIFGGAKPVPFNPERVKYGELGALLVGVAGPLTNLFIAFICYGFMVISSGTISDVFLIACVVNLGFFIFNMIPIPPLDGSRILYYLAPDGARRVMASMEMYGIFIILAVVLLFNSVLVRYMQNAIEFFLTVFSKIFGV